MNKIARILFRDIRRIDLIKIEIRLRHIGQLYNIMLKLRATSFAPFSLLYRLRYPPMFSDSFKSTIEKYLHMFKIILFQELKI